MVIVINDDEIKEVRIFKKELKQVTNQKDVLY